MNRLTIGFHGRLNDFLPKRYRATTFDHEFDEAPSIKDLIESLGVPHPEVEVMLVNGTPVDFDTLVRHGDRIAVYPDLDDVITDGQLPSVHVRPAPLAEARFILDVHLGRLAAHLRMAGFDTLYRNDYEDDELARISSAENRILLTRDLGVLKRGIVVYGYFVRETKPERQLAEILRRYKLFEALNPFHRCTDCNGVLVSVDKDSISDRLEARTKQFYHDFRLCQGCGKIYWKGNHYERMQRFFNSLTEQKG